MATQPLEHPATAVSPTDMKEEIAERLTILGQRIEALAQATIDANDEIASEKSLPAKSCRKINFVAWPLLDAAREAGREVVDLGVKLENLR